MSEMSALQATLGASKRTAVEAELWGEDESALALKAFRDAQQGSAAASVPSAILLKEIKGQKRAAADSEAAKSSQELKDAKKHRKIAANQQNLEDALKARQSEFLRMSFFVAGKYQEFI